MLLDLYPRDSVRADQTQWMGFPAPTRTGCRLHTPPPGTATLAVGPGDQVDALAVASTRFTNWRLDASVGPWSKIGTVTAPIQFGSSS